MNFTHPRGIQLEIRNESRKFRAPIAYLKKQTKKMICYLGWKNALVTVVLVDDRKMKNFNRRFLGHNRTTDVIAFDANLSGLKNQKKRLMGDLLISLPTAKRQATLYGNTYHRELCLYICHGILHLMGYRDKTKQEAFKMGRKQERVLNAASF